MEKEFIIPKREVTSIDIDEVNKLLEGHSYFELLTEAPTTTYQAQLFDSEGMGTSLMFRIVLREDFTSYIGIQIFRLYHSGIHSGGKARDQFGIYNNGDMFGRTCYRTCFTGKFKQCCRRHNNTHYQAF